MIMPKKNRAIALESGIVFDKKTFKPGDEDELASVAPQWNLDQMAGAGWLTGDWSNAGVTPEEESAANEEKLAAATKPSGRKTAK